jgi:Natural resistance-associated macrophage protein
MARWIGGFNATNGIVLSQVTLSLALPAPLIALILLTRDKSLMGSYANGRWTDAAAIIGGVLIVAPNAVLLLQALGAAIPGLGGIAASRANTREAAADVACLRASAARYRLRPQQFGGRVADPNAGREAC